MALPSDKWNRAKDLYEAALEHDPAQRLAFIQQNEQDDAVCEEVRRLLAEHERLGSFLSLEK